MDSNKLRYFIVVNETENLRKAAEVLHISPAALSKAIKQLEFEIGTKLLVPVGRGISITAAGRELASRAQSIMENLAQLKIDFKQKKTTANQIKIIRIGTFEIFSTHFLSHLIHNLPNSNELILNEVVPGEIENKLLNQEIDYGITSMPVPTQGIQHKKIAAFSLKIFGRNNVFNSMAFSQLPFVAPIQPIVKSPNKIKTLDGWPDGQFNRYIKYKVNMMESALELCRQSKAVAYLPTFIAALHNKTVKSSYNLQPIAFPIGMPEQKQTIYLVKRKTDPNDNIFEILSSALKDICDM